MPNNFLMVIGSEIVADLPKPVTTTVTRNSFFISGSITVPTITVASSEINANPNDHTVYPEGVWTLPPTYQMGDENRAEWEEIGESDRMTLKFRKPAI